MECRTDWENGYQAGKDSAEGDKLELRQEIDRLKAALAVAQSVCGQNNCNCPGASRVVAALKAVA